MRIIKKILPHVTVAFMLALITLVIFNNHNPRMGFLQGREANILIVSAAVSGILTSILMIADSFRKN